MKRVSVLQTLAVMCLVCGLLALRVWDPALVSSVRNTGFDTLQQGLSPPAA